MSGNDHNNHCRIGKVTPKVRLLDLASKDTASKARQLFVDAIAAIDAMAHVSSPAKPVVSFYAMVWTDGRVELRFADEGHPESNSGRDEKETGLPPSINWRELGRLLEEVAQDIRYFGLYQQRSPVAIFRKPDETASYSWSED